MFGIITVLVLKRIINSFNLDAKQFFGFKLKLFLKRRSLDRYELPNWTTNCQIIWNKAWPIMIFTKSRVFVDWSRIFSYLPIIDWLLGGEVFSNLTQVYFSRYAGIENVATRWIGIWKKSWLHCWWENVNIQHVCKLRKFLYISHEQLS